MEIYFIDSVNCSTSQSIRSSVPVVWDLSEQIQNGWFHEISFLMLAEAFLVATGSSWWSSPAPAGQRSRHHPPSHHQQGNHHHHTPGPTNVCLPCCNCCTSVVHSTILSVLLTVDIFIYIYINMIIRCNDSLSVIQVHFSFLSFQVLLPGCDRPGKASGVRRWYYFGSGVGLASDKALANLTPD